jgi:hypothetical protein
MHFAYEYTQNKIYLKKNRVLQQKGLAVIGIQVQGQTFRGLTPPHPFQSLQVISR